MFAPLEGAIDYHWTKSIYKACTDAQVPKIFFFVRYKGPFSTHYHCILANFDNNLYGGICLYVSFSLFSINGTYDHIKLGGNDFR